MIKKATTHLVPESIGVKKVPTHSLVPNPHNPRMLFDRAPLEDLRNSIEKFGILVPLTVYRSAEQKRFVILDGQRRWICAQELNLNGVPVNVVAKPTLVQNIVTMFQIHRLRLDWELMPTALKLEVLIEVLNDRNTKRLSALTALNPTVIDRCKKLLSYSRKYQDLMLDPDPTKRVRADFFIELYAILIDRLVKKMDWFSRDEFTQRMLKKYLNRRGIRAVTDFRMMKQYINNARNANKDKLISKRLEEFTFNDSLTLNHLAIKSADVSASARKLLNNVNKIEEAIKDIDAEEYYGEEELWQSLERLLSLIRSKLLAAGRRLKE